MQNDIANRAMSGKERAMKRMLTTASILGLLAVPAWAANPPAANPPPGNPPNAAPSTNAPSPPPANPPANQQGAANAGQQGSPDSDFVQKAAAGGQAEVEMGKLAEQQAGTAAVKEFGRWMVTDHTLANDMLMKAAQQANIQAPTSPTQEQQDSLNKLKTLHGAAFDRAYMSMMVKDHTEDVDLFRNQAQSGQNEQIKTFAQNTLPVLQAHLAEAQELSSGEASTHKPAASTARLNERELKRHQRSRTE
jgi:putative membrane protein